MVMTEMIMNIYVPDSMDKSKRDALCKAYTMVDTTNHITKVGNDFNGEQKTLTGDSY